MAIDDRHFVPASTIPTSSTPDPDNGRPLGALFAFITKEDAHSPVMLDVYAEIVEQYDEKIPLFFIDTAHLVNEPYLNKYRIFSVPTLLWVKDDKILTRHVGTTMVRKLRHDMDKKLDELLA